MELHRAVAPLVEPLVLPDVQDRVELGRPERRVHADALKIPPVEIPQQVKEAAERLGTVITYVHRLKGYDVYSVGMPPDEKGEIQPTGLPTLVLYKSGNARIVGGMESFNWL